jgi:hypothetical protein
METFYGKKDKKEFRDIVLAHLEKILEISTREFKPNNKRVVNRASGGIGYSEVIIEEDTRKCFIQAVESLAYLLLSYYDDKLKKEYNKLIGIFDLRNYEFWEEAKDYVQEQYKLFHGKPPEGGVPYDFIDNLLVREQLRNAKILFRELNLLLNRVDYLKTAVYGEGDLDDDED